VKKLLASFVLVSACQRGPEPATQRTVAPVVAAPTTQVRTVAPRADDGLYVFPGWKFEYGQRSLDGDAAKERAKLQAIAAGYAGIKRPWRIRAKTTLPLALEALKIAANDLTYFSGGRFDVQITDAGEDSVTEIRPPNASDAAGMAARTDAKGTLILLDPSQGALSVDDLAEVILREWLTQIAKIRDGVMAQKGLPTVDAAKANGWDHMRQHGGWWSWYRDFADLYVAPTTWETLGDAAEETLYGEASWIEAPAAIQVWIEPTTNDPVKVVVNDQEVSGSAGLAAGWNKIQVTGAPVRLTRFGAPLQGVRTAQILPDGAVAVAAVDPALVADGFSTYRWRDVRRDPWRSLPIVTMPMLRALTGLQKLELKHHETEVFFTTDTTTKNEVDPVGSHQLDNGLFYGQEGMAMLPVTMAGEAQYLVLLRPEAADATPDKATRLLGYVSLPGRVLLVGLAKEAL